MFITDSLLEGGRLFHGFFGRNDGVSQGIYKSLNCGYGSADPAENVRANRGLVAEKAGFTETDLVTVNQCHSPTCITVTRPWAPGQAPQADALATDREGLLLGVLTADCAPVLLSGTKEDGSMVIGAAHAGWRGAFGGVIGSVVDDMIRLGAQPASIVACIGPCLGPASYEVDAPFRDQFLEKDKGSTVFFRPAAAESKFLFDLPAFVSAQLNEAGVTKVAITQVDTYSNEEVIKALNQNLKSVVKPRSLRLQPSFIDIDHPFIQSGIEMGMKPYGSPTLSDQALIPYPSIKIGPGDSARSHTPDEYIYVQEVRNGIKLYIDLLQTYFDLI